MIKMFAGRVRYQTLDSITCLLISQSSPFGTTLLKLPFHHTFRLSILLLISHPQLYILLLVEIAKVRFYKALSNSTNSESEFLQASTNSYSGRKQPTLSLLPTALFKSPKSAFSTIII